MSEKKHKKSIEELCRSRLCRTAAGDMWSLAQTSSHRLFRSPSPRTSCSRSRRRSENTARRSLLMSREVSTEYVPGTSVQHNAHDGEKRMKKPFFPGIPTQVVTHAEPPFAGSDTQPLPPINMSKGQDASKQGKDNRPFTVYGQTPFDNGVSYDLIFAANEERANKRKLEAIRRPEEQNRQEWYSCDVSGQPRDSDHHGKKKCGGKKKGRRARKFPKPLAWKSPWPSQDAAHDSDSDAEWIDIN